MTAQATQSNTALGRRSSPYSFFAPLETLGRYMDRNKSEDPSVEGHPAGLVDLADSACLADSDGLDDSADFGHPDHPGQRAAAEFFSEIGGRDDLRFNRGSAKNLAESELDLSAARLPTAHGPAAFAEVARRVWSEAAPMQYRTGDADAAAIARAAASAPDPSPAAAPRATAVARRDLVPAVNAGSNARPDVRPDVRLDARRGARPGLREALALAHDANNLLSALRLYSELLCFSGVLHERHRHYADDLKLLSLRSERLIGRLVKLAEEVAAADGADAPSAPFLVGNSESGSEAGEIGAADLEPGYPIAGDLPAGGFGAGGIGAGGIGAGGIETDAGIEARTSTVASVLNRLGGLLGTLARGALKIDAGDTDELPIAVPVESLERILVNLVSNAAAATRESGAVRIRAAVLGERGPDTDSGTELVMGKHLVDGLVVALTVDDSGCGMSEAQVQAALGYAGLDDANPEANTASAARRHGLGLSIVRELVAASGGRLFIQSRPGTGTRIEIRWRAATSNALRQAPAGYGRSPAATAERLVSGRGAIPIPQRKSAGPSWGVVAHEGLRRSELAAETEGAVA